MGSAAVGRGARAVVLQVGAGLTQEAIRLLVVAKGHRMRMLGNEGDLAPILLRADGLAALGAAALLSLQHGGALFGRQRAAGHCASCAPKTAAADERHSLLLRSEARRVGKAWVSTCQVGWATDQQKKKTYMT